MSEVVREVVKRLYQTRLETLRDVQNSIDIGFIERDLDAYQPAIQLWNPLLFFDFLVDMLSHEFNVNNPDVLVNPIDHIFKFEVTETYQCLNDHHNSSEGRLWIRDLDPKQDLEASIRSVFELKNIFVECDKCKEVRGFKQQMVRRLPEILVIGFRLFNSNGFRIGDKTKVPLNISSGMLGYSEETTFKLFAMTAFDQTTDSTENAKYVAVVKKFKKSKGKEVWLRFQKREAHSISEEDVLTAMAPILLFYGL